MLARFFLWALPVLAMLAPLPARAAASAQALSPHSVSILGGTSRDFSVRFFDGTGRPSVGETVFFSNDACGFFQNGSGGVSVTTDATGTATARFTARNQGITCWVTATAGVSVRFDVYTFTLPQVHIETELDPPQPLPGERVEVTVRPMAGAYPLYEVDVDARIVPGTTAATISPARRSSGQSGRMSFDVYPQGRGEYAVELQWRNVLKSVTVREHPAPWQDMWWGGLSENGWGVSVVQHRDVLFAVIYAYDSQGRPTWYVMPGGAWNAEQTAYTGALYSPRGAPFDAYDAKSFAVGAPVGAATLRYLDAGNGVLEYTINGVSSTRFITRQRFGVEEQPLATSFADMWWGGLEQNGWGIAVLQQYRALFGVWFTYDSAGAPTWFVMPSGFWRDASTYEGRLYRANGAAWLGVPYDARAFRTTDVGNYRIRFAGEQATFEYTIDGRSGTMALSRQPF